jgi:L-ascorbate oxidase
MRYTVGAALALLSLWTRPASAALRRHDASFAPNYILYATAGNITIDCQSRYSVLLNGTSPGPPLYLKEGETSWVRVYNKIPYDNLTVVSLALIGQCASAIALTIVALAWPDRQSCSLLRWNTPSKPVAYCARAIL